MRWTFTKLWSSKVNILLLFNKIERNNKQKGNQYWKVSWFNWPLNSCVEKLCVQSSLEIHVKLKVESAKDPNEIIPCVQDCVENRMFSCTETFFWIFMKVQYVRWVAFDAAVVETGRVISAIMLGEEQLGSQVFMPYRWIKSSIAKDIQCMPRNWSNVWCW